MTEAYKTDILEEEIPTLPLTTAGQLQEGINCLACSEDGRYLSLGHCHGLSIWCMSSLDCVTEWLQDTLEITSIQMTRMAESVYLLGTVDDMGVARIFSFQSRDVHLLSVINPMESVNNRSICLNLKLSEGGAYGAAEMSCNGDVWLEVYYLPTEAWLKELEKTLSQTQDPTGDVDPQWSQFAAVFKIRPAEAKLRGRKDAKMADFVTHCLSQDKETSNSCPRRCTHHFLLPCGQSSCDGLSVAVCVWWTGSYNLLQYSLPKLTKNKQDVQLVPDALWPNAKEILCSAVSRCTRFIAVGLDSAMVCIWDRLTGFPLPIVSLSAAGSALCRVQFVDNWPESADDLQTLTAKVHLVVLCKNGIIYRLTAGRGTESCKIQLRERPKDNRDLPAVIMNVPFLQGLVLVVQRNGKMLLQDIINQTTVCYLNPPASHLISTPCKPVYALSATQKTLLIQGYQDPGCSVPSDGGSQSQVLTFCFEESDITKRYNISTSDFPQQQTVSCLDLEESCNLYLKQRAQSVDERSKALTTTLKQHSRAAAS